MEDENLIEDAAFIDLVQPRSWLYDLDHLKHKDNKYKENTWTVVAEGMGWADDELDGTGIEKCKKTWKRLRDNFWRVHKKAPSGSGATEGKIWPLYQKMTFLLSIKKKNTRQTASNYTSKCQPVETPTQQWDGVEELFILGGSSGDGEGLANQQPANTEIEASSTEDSSSSSTLPFEKNTKKRPPERVNPPADTFAKKKITTNKKFEEMLTKGFSSLDKLVESTCQQKQQEPQPSTSATANTRFAEYLAMELEEIPVEHQGAIRKAIIVCLNEEKDKRNI